MLDIDVLREEQSFAGAVGGFFLKERCEADIALIEDLYGSVRKLKRDRSELLGHCQALLELLPNTLATLPQRAKVTCLAKLAVERIQRESL